MLRFTQKWRFAENWLTLGVWEYSEECSIASLTHQWMLCSEWVPSEWESKQLIKHQQIKKSLLCIILLSPVKRSSGLNQERNMHWSSTVYEQKWSKKYFKQICGCILMWETALLWIKCMESCFGQKLLLMMDLESQDVNWWTVYQLFGLSFWRHPFTAEHPLLRQWWNDTFLKNIQMKKQTHISWMVCGWINVKKCLVFRWTITLRTVFHLPLCFSLFIKRTNSRKI